MAAYVDQGSCVSNDAALSPQIIGETGPLTGGYPVDRSKWAQYLLVVAASSVVGALFSYGYVSYSKSTSKTTSLFHSVSAGSKPAIHVHGGAHIIARQSHNANDPRKLVVPTGNGPDQPSTTLSSHRNNGDFEASQTQVVFRCQCSGTRFCISRSIVNATFTLRSAQARSSTPQVFPSWVVCWPWSHTYSEVSCVLVVACKLAAATILSAPALSLADFGGRRWMCAGFEFFDGGCTLDITPWEIPLRHTVSFLVSSLCPRLFD